jgi:hypothetical protein
MEHLRRFYRSSGEAEGARRQGVVAAVRLMLTAAAFLLNVDNLTVCRHFAIAASDASASESRESEEAN